MDLFTPDTTTNLLPCDGMVLYSGRVCSMEIADRYFEELLQKVPWRSDEVIMFGKRRVTARKMAWYGDAHCAYTYSGITREALPWITELLELKEMVEEHSEARYNSCLLNLYHDGGEGMSWHSDDERTILRDSAIASLSFGAERRFCFKHKRTDQRAEMTLEHGSLLVMKGSTQTHWLHSVPKSQKISAPRINLTFRHIIG